MGVKVTFNPDTRVIEVKSGVTALDVGVDLYSDAKEDWLSDATLNKIEFPFVPIGGNALVAGQVSPAYFFLKYPWKIQTTGDGTILGIALNLYGLAENGIDSRTQDETYIVIPGDGLSATNSDLPGFDSEMNKAIRYSSFGGGVSLNNITGVSGTAYPIGNKENPVDNLTDAVTIANANGFNTIFIETSMTLNAGSDLTGFNLIGNSKVDTLIVVGTSAVTNDVRIVSCNVSGVLDGGTRLSNCYVGDITYFNGEIRECGLYGTIYLDGNAEAVIVNCYTVDQDNSPVVDMGGTGQDLAMPNYSGLVTIKNLTSATEEVGVGLNAGGVILDSTITAGNFIIGGTGVLTDNSTSVTDLNVDGLINKDIIAQATWDEATADHTTTGTTGKALTDAGLAGNPWSALTSDNELPGTFGAEVATKSDINASSQTDQSFALSGTATQGTVISGTYADTSTRNGVYWEVQEDAVNGLEVEMTFNLPSASHRPGVVDTFGRYIGVPSTTHYMELWAYNYESLAWELLQEIYLPGGMTSDADYSHEYYERHVDRDNNNEVKIRLIHNDTTYSASHELYLDSVAVTSIKVITAEDVAIAVWDEPTTSHSTDSTFGYLMQKVLTVAKFLGLK